MSYYLTVSEFVGAPDKHDDGFRINGIDRYDNLGKSVAAAGDITIALQDPLRTDGATSPDGNPKISGISIKGPPQSGTPQKVFRRGDADGNGALEITDPILTLGYLFLGEGNDIFCLDAADADDNGDLELTDAVYSLGYQFLGGENPAPPPPGEVDCGIDPTPDNPDLPGADLGCEKYPADDGTPCN